MPWGLSSGEPEPVEPTPLTTISWVAQIHPVGAPTGRHLRRKPLSSDAPLFVCAHLGDFGVHASQRRPTLHSDRRSRRHAVVGFKPDDRLLAAPRTASRKDWERMRPSPSRGGRVLDWRRRPNLAKRPPFRYRLENPGRRAPPISRTKNARESPMNEPVNRQIPADRKARGEARARTFQACRKRGADAEGRRGSAARALYLARRGQSRLDLNWRDLSFGARNERGHGGRRRH